MTTIWQHRGLPILTLAYASIVDWAITIDMLSIGHAEANPIMAQLSPTGMLLAKLASLGIVMLLSKGLDSTRPSWTLPALWLAVLGQSAVVVWNILVLVLTGGGMGL